MDAIDNRTGSGLRAEAANTPEEHNDSTLEKPAPGQQTAKTDTNAVLESLQQEQQQAVQGARPTLNPGTTPGPGGEWDPWKIMIIKKP
jgi:hypothetical protein